MERRINKKLENYTTNFKENVKQKAIEIAVEFGLGLENDAKLSQLIQYIYDYDRLVLTKEDFMKRKRIKNTVKLSERCCAKRANGEQCTRRRKDETTEYCGTHLKGTPHGICDFTEEQNPSGQKIQIFTQEIQGIIYYIDNNSNVYQMEDIIQNKSNPKVIAKYLLSNDVYSIPEFNI
jgi:hypothetical protein